MKTFIVAAFVAVASLFATQSVQAQSVLLANSDVCNTDVVITWDAFPCSFAIVTTGHSVPPVTNITVPPPIPGAWVVEITVIYAGQGPVQHVFDPCGFYSPIASLPATSCTGNPTFVDFTQNAGPSGLTLVDINF